MDGVLALKIAYLSAVVIIVSLGAFIIKRGLAFAAKVACHNWDSRILALVPLIAGLCCVVVGLILLWTLSPSL